MVWNRIYIYTDIFIFIQILIKFLMRFINLLEFYEELKT